MADVNGGNEDLKAKMREALARKQGRGPAAGNGAPAASGREKAHGPEVRGSAPKVHRRKAGGGGS
jgi:hypothetical protein